MNVEHVKFELAEAASHLRDLLEELHAGTIGAHDNPALAVRMAHIMEHFCRGWNCREQSVEEIAALPQGEYERASFTFPNFLGQRALGEFDLC